MPTFGTPQAVTVTGYTGSLMEPFIAKNDTTLFFNCGDPDRNIHYATKVNNTTFAYAGTVSGVNTLNMECAASMDANGLFYFSSDRSKSIDRLLIYRGTYANGVVSSVSAVVGLSRTPGNWMTLDGEISVDGTTFWFSDNPVDDAGRSSSLAFATKNADGTFTRAANSDTILQNVNSLDTFLYAPSISADGLTLLFTRCRGAILSSNQTRADIWATTRPNTTSPFAPPVLVYMGCNTFSEGPSLSGDGTRLYVHDKNVDGSYSIVMLTRTS